MRFPVSSPLVTLLVLILCASCASLDFVPVKRTDPPGTPGKCADRSGEKDIDGIRYYDVSPYLIVHSNPDGTLAIRLIYLPDPNKKMSVHPKAISAKIETTLEFENGSLKTSQSLADATVVPKAILEAAKTVLPLVLDAPIAPAKPPQTDYVVPPPHVFKVVVRGGQTYLLGEQAKGDPILISLVAEEEEKATSSGGSDTSGQGGQS